MHEIRNADVHVPQMFRAIHRGVRGLSLVSENTKVEIKQGSFLTYFHDAATRVFAPQTTAVAWWKAYQLTHAVIRGVYRYSKPLRGTPYLN